MCTHSANNLESANISLFEYIFEDATYVSSNKKENPTYSFVVASVLCCDCTIKNEFDGHDAQCENHDDSLILLRLVLPTTIE